MDEMGDVQLDAVVPRAVRMAPAVGTASPETADGRLVQERILAWDATCGVASQGCAAWFTFELALLRAVLDDDLGLELASEYVGAPPSWVLLERLLDDPDAGWWDDVTTAGVRETRDGVMAAVLDRVGADLRVELGGPGRWTWGRLHQVTFREATLGESGIPPLDWAFNARPEPVAGAAGALLNTYHRPSLAYPDPEAPDESGADVGEVFGVTNLPSYRLLIDMSEIDRARIVITTGQSGNPLSPHYADLVDDWAAGRTIPLPFSRNAVRAAAVETLTLRP
jgi:penicillin amidase